MNKNAVLFVNLHKKYAAELSEQIKTELGERAFNTEIFPFSGNTASLPLELSPQKGKWDIAFSLGGDGTVLHAARRFAPLGIPILPVNLGTLGFIAEVEKNNWLDVFLKWEKGEITVSRRCMLDISVVRGGKVLMKNICLNDAVACASGIAKLIMLDVQISGGFLSDDAVLNIQESSIALGSYRCDGLIISTPTGSTAYSMAAGGPILDPEMEAVIINPICPFALSNRPFVLPSRQMLSVTVAEKQRCGVLLTVDGQYTFNLEPNDRVIIRQSPQPAQLVLAGKHTYYSALRSKLFWLPSITDREST